MNETTISEPTTPQLSEMAEAMVGSEIIKLAGKVKALQQKGT